MNVYVESSAVLSWLLGEAQGAKVAAILESAEASVSSDVTLVECDRALARGAALGELSDATAASLRARFESASREWSVLPLSAPIVERARRPFPEEPIRTLDALHVASALHARSALPDLVLLSLDARVRRVANRLGFALAPA